MKKLQVNYAFIDGNNLHVATLQSGWSLDYKRFRIYLSEHYGVKKAYYFIGFMPGNTGLYSFLQAADYHLIFKPILETPEGKVKGNCDAELVLQVMIDINEYEKAVIVSGDGDFYCLVNYLFGKNELECVLAPWRMFCSKLLKIAARENIYFIDNLRDKLEYKK